jgi:hypothetical protein
MNTNQQTLQRPDRHGSNNPMYGRHHTEESKQKMSQLAKDRYERFRNTPQPQPPMTMDEFLKNNPTVKEYIDNIIKEEINKVVWNKYHQ